jgi:peptidoglycan/LPS O-acetylase OafA/YrhL
MPEVLALTLIFAIAIAAVSYALVESPCREALRRWESRRKRDSAEADAAAVRPPDSVISRPQEDAIAP